MTAVALEKAPVAYGQRGVQLTTLDELFRFSQAVAQSGLAPRGMDTPQKIMVAVQAGAEVGLSPMQAVHSYAVINGKPSLMVEPAMALVMASGLLTESSREYTGEGPTRACRVQLVRRGGHSTEWTYSMEDAKRAGVSNKDPWKQHPDRMLYARAAGYCMHDLFPDVLRGHRIGGVDDFEPSGRVQVEVLKEPPLSAPTTFSGPDPLMAQIEAGNTPIALELDVEPREAILIEESEDGERFESNDRP